MSQFSLKNAWIWVRDGDSPVNELEVKVGDGNVTWNETKNREYTLDRGNLDEVRDGDDAPVELTIDAKWEWIKASTGDTPTLVDALKKRGEAAEWVSSDTDTCRPYAVDIIIQYRPDCGTEEMELITFPDFRYEKLSFDAKAGTFNVSGKCNVVEPTVERATSTTSF